MQNQEKRKAMDAVSHAETAQQKRAFQRHVPDTPVGHTIKTPVPGNRLTGEVKRRVMDAVSNVETVAQVGVVKLTGGVAVYAARIREMDREGQQQRAQARSGPQQRPPSVERLGRE